MSQYINFWQIFRSKNESISPPPLPKTSWLTLTPILQILQILLILWVSREMFLLFWRKCTHNGYIESVVPGPGVWPVFGHLAKAVPIRAAGLKKFHEWTNTFPVMFKFMVSSFIPIVYVHHPAPIKELLTVNLPKERKYVYRFLEAYTDKLASFEGAEVDAVQECGMLALDTLLRCTFSLEKEWQHDRQVARFVRLVSECVSILTRRIYNPVWYLDCIFFRLPAGKKFMELVNEAREFSRQIIEKSDAESRHDSILSHVLDASDTITMEDLANEVTTLLFAGHDTTAHALAFCLVLLAQHKTCWERCKKEVSSCTADRNDSTGDLRNVFPYVYQCLQETLRLYPSVPIVAKRTDRPMTFCGINFPSNTWFAINFYSLHRHRKFWKDPLKFDPERFSKDNMDKITPFTYLPFSAGPRNCIGSKLAVEELLTALVQVVRTFDQIHCVKFGEVYSDVVLRPEEIKLRFVRNSKPENER